MAKKGEPPLGLLPIHIGIWLHFLGCFVKMDDLASQSWWFITAKQFLWFIKCVIQIIPFLKSDDPALWSEWSRSSTSWRDCSRWSSSWSLMIQHPEAISLLLRFMFAPPLFNDKTCVAPPPEHQIKCYPPSKNVPPILYNIGATSLSILPHSPTVLPHSSFHLIDPTPTVESIGMWHLTQPPMWKISNSPSQCD